MSNKYIKRIVVATHLGTGLYADECCDVGPCTLAPGHSGTHRAFESDRYHPIDGKAGEIDWPASFAAYAAENEAISKTKQLEREIGDVFDRWFQDGALVAEKTFDTVSKERLASPYPLGSLADHWWTLGFSYAARILRALTAEQKVKEYAERFGDLEVTP